MKAERLPTHLKETFPTHVDLMWPTIKALKALDGSGHIEEIFDKLVELERYSEEIQKVPHGRQSKLAYRAAWARTYLKNIGLITNSGAGVWALTDAGESVKFEDISALLSVEKSAEKLEDSDIQKPSLESKTQDDQAWKTQLLNTLTSIDPSAFERLCQRILRESGFIKVQVTGKTGDGGIDGTGVLRMNLISFHVFFQSKRYQGSVGAGAVRDFRGAMTGRGDKGLIITTGSFTSDARKEASRDGAPAIDLIDGEELCDLLKRLKLGVSTELREEMTVDAGFFHSV